MCSGRAVNKPHPFVARPIGSRGKFVNENNENGTLTIAQPHSRQVLRRKSWRAITHRGSLVVFPVLAALTWTQCDFSGREIPDWKPILALADAAWGKGDLDDAKHLYLQAGNFAVWRDDWAGLLAAACGIEQLERERGSLLLRSCASSSRHGRSRERAKSIRTCCGSKSLCSAWGGQSRLHGPIARREELGRRNQRLA